MKAEIITIGDEILIGQIVDTNSAWLGTVLNEEGIEVTRINSISDTPEAIVEAIEGLYAGDAVGDRDRRSRADQG